MLALALCIVKHQVIIGLGIGSGDTIHREGATSFLVDRINKSVRMAFSKDVFVPNASIHIRPLNTFSRSLNSRPYRFSPWIDVLPEILPVRVIRRVWNSVVATSNLNANPAAKRGGLAAIQHNATPMNQIQDSSSSERTNPKLSPKVTSCVDVGSFDSVLGLFLSDHIYDLHSKNDDLEKSNQHQPQGVQRQFPGELNKIGVSFLLQFFGGISLALPLLSWLLRDLWGTEVSL